MELLHALCVLVLCMASGVTSQVTFKGRCPRFRNQPNFDVRRYTGRWYEQEKFFVIYELNQICVSADYQLLPGGSVRVNNKGFNTRQGRYIRINGDAVISPYKQGQLGVRFFPGQPRSAYNVLATDYRTYSMVFSCRNSRDSMGPTNQQSLWILTRSPFGISPEVRAQLLHLAQSIGIDTRYLIPNDQFNCPSDYLGRN